MPNKIKQSINLEWAVLRVLGRCSTFLFTAPTSGHERRWFWSVYGSIFGEGRPVALPQIECSLLLAPETRVYMTALPAEFVNVSLLELTMLASLAAQLRCETVFEFGTADGRTAYNIALNLPSSSRVFTLNLHPDCGDGKTQGGIKIGHLFHDRPESPRIVQLWGDTGTYDFGPYANRCQLVFIDADHTDAAVTRDTAHAQQIVDQQNGLILWHDATRFGVRTALPRIAAKGLPIHLIAGTSLAILAYFGGKPVTPHEWRKNFDRQPEAVAIPS